MNQETINREFGRRAFGADPAAYHAARPSYPEWVFKLVQDKCGLGPGTSLFEIGAGTGTATQRLLELGAKPLIAIEPDARLAEYLRNSIPDRALEVIETPFEDVMLTPQSFDIGVSATSFHWLDEGPALEKVSKLLKPGGWWAVIWNVFGDDNRPDPFHNATTDLLMGPSSPSAGTRGIEFALDVEARINAIQKTNKFGEIHYQIEPWQLVLDSEQVKALYGTFSNVNFLPHRDFVLAELGRIAQDQFQNKVTRNMLTVIYLARRIGAP